MPDADDTSKHHRHEKAEEVGRAEVVSGGVPCVEAVVDAEALRQHALGPVPVATKHLSTVPEDAFREGRSDARLGRREVDLGVGRFGSLVPSAKRCPRALLEIVEVLAQRAGQT